MEPNRKKNRETAFAAIKDLTDRVKQVPILRVIEHFYPGDELKQESNGWKVRINGFLFKIWKDSNGFSSFVKEIIPGYNKTAGNGSIDFRIAAEAAGGNIKQFEEVRNELAAAFGLTLDPRVMATSRPAAPAPPPAPKKTIVKEPLFSLPPEIEGHDFGHHWVNLTYTVRDYLINARALPADLVDRMLREKTAYPTLATKDILYADGKKKHIEEPAVVFPMRGLRTPAPVGFAYKTLPMDPRFKSFAASEGNPGYGFFSVNQLDWEKIKHMQFSEGCIDALARHVIIKAEEDTCCMAFAAARIPNEEEFPDFYRTIAARGVKVTAAYDADHAGHHAALRLKAVCEKFGITYAHDYVKNSEITLKILAGSPDSPVFLERLRGFITKNNLPHKEHAFDPTSEFHVFTVQNTIESALEMEAIEKVERIQRSALGDEAKRRERKEKPVFQYEIENKDWDDELKGKFRPVLPIDPQPAAPTPATVSQGEPSIG